MKKRTDLTPHGDDEIIDVIMNDTMLYPIYNRAITLGDFGYIKSVIDEAFIYTEDQLSRLEEYFDEEMGNTD